MVLFALIVFRGHLHDLFDRVTEVCGAGFNAKFANAARALSTGSKSEVETAVATESALPIPPKAKPKPFDWSEPPKNLATFHVEHFSEVHGIVVAYENGQPVDVDVKDASHEDRFES